MRLLALAALVCCGLAAQADRVIAEKRLDATHSVELIEAAGQARLVVVSNATHDEVLTLDRYATKSIAATPELEVIGSGAAYLHFYGDYGFYYGSRKYLFDLAGGKPPVRIPYGTVSLRTVSRQGERLNYLALFIDADEVELPLRQKEAMIAIVPRVNALPKYEITTRALFEQPVPVEQLKFQGPGGETVLVQHGTPPGQPHRASTIFVNDTPFLAPIPTFDFYRQKRQDQPPFNSPPGELESDIGPFVKSGDQIWFATTFYDGEGTSGIGAIGSFDIAARKYTMRYLPEITPWSGSAILLDGTDLWIGLTRHPEGADMSGGLLRYNITTGKVRTFTTPDVIFTIDRAGDAIYCGSSHGLYLIRADQVTQLRFEPDEAGQFVMISRRVPQRAAAQPSAR